MAQMVKYMRTIIESLLAFYKKKLFFCNSVPKRPAVNMMRVTREHYLSAPGQGPGVVMPSTSATK